jgi:hypothetical protein
MLLAEAWGETASLSAVVNLWLGKGTKLIFSEIKPRYVSEG